MAVASEEGARGDPARRDPLVEPATGTGDAELDALFEEFDDVDEQNDESDEEGEDGFLYVLLETSVAAIGAAVGMKDPALNPYDEREGDTVLLFRPKSVVA